MRRGIFLFLLIVIPSLFGSTVEDKLKYVLLDEKICMRKFFDFAIKFDHAAHVLYFENKPVCLTGVVIKDKHRTFRDVLHLKGWKAFRKNENLFPHDNFIFNECLSVSGDFKVLDIYIINKPALEKCLHQNMNVFRECLGDEFTSEWFISRLTEGQPIISLVNDNEILLGILLGFGKEASKAYQVAQEDAKMTIPDWSDTYCGIDSKRPNGCKIYPIGFMGNPHSLEVQTLISIYEKELEVFWKYYQTKNDSLLVFLECLCKE